MVRRNAYILVMLACVVPACVMAQSPADWPQFRGPHRDDISSDHGLLKRWPKDGPALSWRTKGLGTGFSSVSVSNGRIFTMGNRGNDTYLIALDQRSGKQLWSTKVGRADNNLGCTPTVDGDRVYGIGQDGDLVCASTGNGELVWRKHFKRDFGGACGGWNYTESPLVDGEKLVCTPGAKDALVVSLNKRTGATIWKCRSPFPEATAGYSSVVRATVGGVQQYIQLTAGGVVGIRVADGSLLWSNNRLGSNTANIPCPIVLKDRILSVTGYGKGAVLLQLTGSGGGVNASEVYYTREFTNKHGGVLVLNGYVYGDFDDTGRPFCAEVATGKIVWRKEERGLGRGSAAVTYADGNLYFRFDNGIVSLVEASPSRYNEISSFKIPDSGSASWAHPVVTGGKLYLREQDSLFCYDVK